MNLDPTVSPWIGIVASTGVCLWMAAIGVPLSRAVFGDRPRLVWPFYAPALGVVVVLLVTNLSAYLIPGAPSAWFGLLAPSVLAAYITWRSGQIRLPSRRKSLETLVFLLGSAGLYVLTFANRAQSYHTDESWHHAIALRLARGVFPPTTPYGPGAGMGYHYGHNLLASSIVNAAAVPAWTAMVVLESFFVVALILAGIGFARDRGGSLPVSLGVGAVLGLAEGTIRVGLPPYLEASGQSEGFARFLEGLAPIDASLAFNWVHRPHFTLAVAIVILIAAAMDGRNTAKVAAVLFVTAGVSALASTSVMIFSSAALGLVVILRLAWLRGLERLTISSALLAAGLLAALAGGAVSDAIFGRGGSASMVRIAFEPNWTQLMPFSLQGPMLIGLGVFPLTAIGATIAYIRRSWGLCYLTLAGVFGVLESVFLQSPIPSNDGRILHLASAVSAFAALSGIAGLSEVLRGRWRITATLALILFVLSPMLIPRATSGIRFAMQGINVGDSRLTMASGYPYLGQTPSRRELFRKDLEENYDFWSYLSSTLSNDARLLTTHPAVSASAAGVAAPTSGSNPEILAPRVTPVYEDALRFLHRDDLADMRITHLHITDEWEKALSPDAQRSLQDPKQFRLVNEMRSISGLRHRVYDVSPGAGTTRVHPSSFRALRELVSFRHPFVVLDGLTSFQREMLLYTLIDHPDLRAPWTLFGRTTRLPKRQPVSDIAGVSTVAVPERLEPLMLGLSADDAIWNGFGIRVYELSSAWSPVWRVEDGFPSTSEPSRTLCESPVVGDLDLKLLGDTGDQILFGLESVRLTGRPQVSNASVRGCQTLRLAAESVVNPFAQARTQSHRSNPLDLSSHAGLGFDGGWDGSNAVVHLWYRNPDGVAFAASTEFRLYEIGTTDITPQHPSPRSSVRWWMGPVELSAGTQMARVSFDPKNLTIDGDTGGGVAAATNSGRAYLLTLNMATVGLQSGLAEIQQQIPLVRFTEGDDSPVPLVYSGIVSIRPPLEVSGLRHEYSSKVGWEVNRTPGFETDEVSR